MERDRVVYHSKSKSFHNFLKWTNEKEKTAEYITKVLQTKRNNLLDIGAGDGTLTKLIEPMFKYITAIEPGPAQFQRLETVCSSEKYSLINIEFEKLSLEEQFDIILASHSLRFIRDPLNQLYHLKSMLKDSGLFLDIEHKRQSGFLKFYDRYREDVLGKNSIEPDSIKYNNVLSEVFRVEELDFPAMLSIPTVDEAIYLLDFIYDIDFAKIKDEVKSRIREDMVHHYGDGVIDIELQQTMYICSK